MATAKKQIETVTTETVELTLTKEEAEVLVFVMERVGGSPRGPRQHADSLHEALLLAGVACPPHLISTGAFSAIYVDSTEA